VQQEKNGVFYVVRAEMFYQGRFWANSQLQKFSVESRAVERRFYLLLAVPGHALLWLSLVKWKRKKRESASF
jgi:hypothetical protein